MPDNKEKLLALADQVNKRDLDIILEVNKKAVEIETEVADQNEEIIQLLNDCRNNQEKMDQKTDKLLELSEETSKDLFKIQVLFITGLLALVAQIVQIFIKK
jgi:Asp-tRNA(Asn)/Glu-tRNA(Gln) amidotransferase C subunit